MDVCTVRLVATRRRHVAMLRFDAEAAALAQAVFGHILADDEHEKWGRKGGPTEPILMFIKAEMTIYILAGPQLTPEELQAGVEDVCRSCDVMPLFDRPSYGVLRDNLRQGGRERLN